MTTNALNLALAKWDGWKRAPEFDSICVSGTTLIWTKDSVILVSQDELPRYTESLDAVWQLEEKLWPLLDTMGIGYLRILEQVVNSSMASCWPIVHATALQRCEALARTLGLWEE